MIYYTSDSRKIEFTPNENYIGSGIQGTVYKLDDDKCIKIYGEDTRKYDREVFELFKLLSLEGYCKLYDLLYNDKYQSEILGYTMKYYQKEVDNILLMPTEYTLDSFNTLYNSIKKLADNRVMARDTIPANAILGKDNITLIDFDACNFSTLDKDVLLEVNTNNILYLFRRLYEEGLKSMGKNIEDKNLAEYLDAIFAYNREPVKALKRRMSYSRTPMDLLPWEYRY